MREMKDSGIKWIGVIPSAWRTARVKNVAETMQSGGTPDSSNDTFYVDIEGGIPWVAIADMSTTPYVKDTNKHISEEGRKSKNLIVFEPGTILYAMYASVGKVSELAVPATINQALLAIVLNSSIDGSFFKYALNAWEPYIISESNGTTQFNLNANKVANLCFPMPNRLEQESIVRYLDTKCAQVDTLIANVQFQIEKLKAYKQSMITEVVTKGLDPTVPMKDSGVEWIGEIPKHWSVIPSKFLFANCDERRREGDVQLTASQKYGMISQEEYMRRENARIVLADKGLENWKHVEPFDFVISLRSFQGGLEMSEVTGCATWHYIILRARQRIHPYYYKWLFKSSMYITTLQRTCNYIRDGQDLRYSNFVKVPLCIPTLYEQQKIADFLDRKCAKIDHLITLKQSKIEKLEQYKRSLIYEYVTGKREIL